MMDGVKPTLFPEERKKMTSQRLIPLLAWALGAGVTGLGADSVNPSVAYIQRTLGRLAASTPERPATARIMFYGQSITAQPWTKLVETELTQRFPSARLVFANPAIGGFSSPHLIRTAESDLYPWYPDLLIFHVYGPVEQYEEIVRNVRTRTTAEIVLWTSHLRADETLDKNPDADPRIGAIREIAKKYDCLLIDVRPKWIAHLQANQLAPKALLKDVVHLNAAGIKLLAAFIGPELEAVPNLSTTAQAGTVSDVPLDSPQVTRGADGSLTLAFTGNRVVAVSAGSGAGQAEVRLDGRNPGELSELWAMARPRVATGEAWPWPPIKRIGFEQAPGAENWTLTCLPDSAADGKKVHFQVAGSVTGEDGEGFSDARFVSKSGRVVIEPRDWYLDWCLHHKKLTLPAGFQIKWKSYPLFAARYESQPAGTETVLVQNCANAAHQLVLKGETAKLGLAGFRVYRPGAEIPPLSAAKGAADKP